MTIVKHWSILHCLLSLCFLQLPPPVIRVLGPKTEYLQRSKQFYEDEGATCSDSHDGYITERLFMEGEMADLDRPGKYVSRPKSATIEPEPCTTDVYLSRGTQPLGDFVCVQELPW